MLLQLEHIRKQFPGVIALDDIRFQLREGEVHVLLGENGAGKSTLVKILSGACRKTSGRILLDGREIEIRNPRHAMDLGIGIIYQELNLVPQLSVAENIFLGREQQILAGVIDQKDMQKKAEQLIDSFSVQLPLSVPVKHLSLAQQQVVEILKALSLNARILIMDEPTSALTDVEISDLFRIIQSLKERQVAIIFISHRMGEVFEIGDRVTVLRDGKYIDCFDINSTNRDVLIRAMVNRDLKEQFPKNKVEAGAEVLRVTGLSRKGVLADINFSLCKGEILGVAGLMGSGRTELVRALFGADPLSSGTIYINGEKAEVKSPRHAIGHGLGLLAEDRQHHGLVLNLSVKHNICLPNLSQFSRFGIMRTKDEAGSAAQYARDLKVKTPNLSQKALYLSGGNQQKVVLAKWLCSHACIFIFDEPTRGIDVGAKVEIYRLMNRLVSEGAAIIMISSELPEILGMSDRIMVMRRGCIVDEISGETATQERVLSSALGVTHES